MIEQTVRVDLQKMRGDLLKWALSQYAEKPVIHPSLDAMVDVYQDLASAYQELVKDQDVSAGMFQGKSKADTLTRFEIRGKKSAYESVVENMTELAGQHKLRARLGEWADIPLEVVDDLVGKYDSIPERYWKHIQYEEAPV